MKRPIARAWYAPLRNFTLGVLPHSCYTTSEATDLLNKVTLLSTRGHLKEALSLFYDAPPKDHTPQTYATLFHACARHGFLQQGRHLHHRMLCRNPNNVLDLFVANHLINLYAKCGDLDHARHLFDEMKQRNVVSWTALISGYAQHGEGNESFCLLRDMLVDCRPNEFAFASVITCCEYQWGRQVHALALKMGLDASVYVGNALITMYSKSRDCFSAGEEEAWTAFRAMEFRNLVSWNSMIAGFQFLKVGVQVIIGFFCQMRSGGIGVDGTTLVSVFSSLSGSYGGTNINVDVGRKCCFQLHCLTIKCGFALKMEVATALVKAYSELGGEVSDCYRLFQETRGCRDIILWTGIITAVAEREPEEAFYLFCQLYRENLAPDWYTFSIVLKACAGLVTDRPILAVYSQVIKAGFEGDTVLANALIHAFARCGSVSLSKQVFDEMRSRDVVSWNSVLKAYALHGKAKEALHLFSQMNVGPDSATMVALLSACSHAGLVEEGIKIFDSMVANHAILPQLDHYACMVDMFGRAGRLIEAKDLINKMTMEPDSVVWSALLASCRKHGETELAKLAADRLKELEPGNSLGYIQMSNVYCSEGSYKEAGIIRKEMKGSRVRKEPGLSWIETGNRVHEFASGGRRHPQREAICSKLDSLIRQLKEIGYVPERSSSLHDIEEEHKEEQLSHHSEKLALACAIFNEGSLHGGGSVLRIMKNIRICVDCHNFMKLASDFLQKEIIVRDSNRFHHFKNRICSCNDYW